MVSRVAGGLVLALALSGGAGRAHAATPAAAVVYETTRMADGAIQFSGSAPGLAFHKNSYADGHFDFEIESGRDKVDVHMSALALRVTRGSRTISLAAGFGATERAQLRKLLAGSAAIKRYEALAADVEAHKDRTLATYGVLLGESTIAWLRGDTAARARIARRLAPISRPVIASRSTTADASRFRPVRMADCWYAYEQEVTNAQNDLVSCYVGAYGSLWQSYYMTGCDFTWAIRAEGYWFEYLSCSAIPLRMS
jgi:hypothetical protein